MFGIIFKEKMPKPNGWVESSMPAEEGLSQRGYAWVSWLQRAKSIEKECMNVPKEEGLIISSDLNYYYLF